MQPSNQSRERDTKLPPPRGIVRASKPDGLLDGRRMLPPPKLAAHVHHLWTLRWDLRSPFIGEALQHPAMQIAYVDTAGERRADLVGVHTGRLMRRLEGEGEIFGITFRPVMFHPLLRASMATLTDRVVPLDLVLETKATKWIRAMHQARTVDDKIAITEALLESLLPPVRPRLVRLRDIVERLAVDRAILRVEDIASENGFDKRALQRLFQQYVGVSPKWVIRRYRLHEAALELQRPNPPALAALAASLGYADQAHFGRDFKRAVGETPRSFARHSVAGSHR
jgi:AraC-like DNA-binding protein